MQKKLTSLWKEISSIDSIQDRVNIIYRDIKENKRKYKSLAEEDPFRFFTLLGGDEANADRLNWAFEYLYEDYLEETEEEYDCELAQSWNVEEESIKRAHEMGFWYVTGIVNVMMDNADELIFELQYSEGYFDGIIGTPYDDRVSHGVLFD